VLPVTSFVLAVVLVNLPFAHQAWTDCQVELEGRHVEATVVEVRTLDGQGFVDYRLPVSVDPSRTRYSARVDDETTRQARETGAIGVDVVPGDPAANRPVGEVVHHLLAVVAAGGLAGPGRARGPRARVLPPGRGPGPRALRHGQRVYIHLPLVKKSGVPYGQGS